jgi:hypothetical protein
MKILIILLFSFVAGALAQDGDSLLKEVPLLSKNITNPDTLASWDAQKEFFLGNDFHLITWNEAKKLIRNRDTITGKQYHTRWFTLYLGEDRYLCCQPAIDSIVEMLERYGIKRNIAPE